MATIVYEGLVKGTIVAAAATDTLLFGPTAYFDGTSGQVDISGFASVSGQISGTAGNDWISLEIYGTTSVAVNISGGDGDDSITDWSWGRNSIWGGAGNDKIGFMGAETSVNAGDGNDIVYASLDTPLARIDGGAGYDTLIFGNMGDITFFGGTADTIIGLETFEKMDGYIGISTGFNFSTFSGTGSVIMGTTRGEAAYAILGADYEHLNGDFNLVRGGSGGFSYYAPSLSLRGSYYGGSGHEEMFFDGGSIADLNATNLYNIDFVNIWGARGSTAADRADLSRLKVGAGWVNGSLDAGDDYFKAGLFASDMRGGDGNDTLIGSTNSDSFYGDAGNDKLTGGAGDDWLEGGAGNDQLTGGLGADRMDGGTGNDTYTVDDTGDQVTEAAGAGTDTVKSSIGYTLGTDVEKLILTGNGGINGTGNNAANALTGNTGANVLLGLAGKDVISGGASDDTIVGGAGADTLTGGTGADRFRFDVLEIATNKDTIKDFVHGTDKIEIDHSVFTAFASSAPGTLNPLELALGTAATTAGQHLIYNQLTGALYYDANGVGGAAQVQIALLTTKPVLDAGDFVLI